MTRAISVIIHICALLIASAALFISAHSVQRVGLQGAYIGTMVFAVFVLCLAIAIVVFWKLGRFEDKAEKEDE